MIYLDTHAAAWLYAGKISLFPDHVQRVISREDLLISPMVTLELQYLFEVGRVSKRGTEVVLDLEKRIGLKICEHSFDEVIKHAIKQDWTRDPFDRVIVAQASIHSTKIVTKDEGIHKNYKHSLWK